MGQKAVDVILHAIAEQAAKARSSPLWHILSNFVLTERSLFMYALGTLLHAYTRNPTLVRNGIVRSALVWFFRTPSVHTSTERNNIII